MNPRMEDWMEMEEEQPVKFPHGPMSYREAVKPQTQTSYGWRGEEEYEEAWDGSLLNKEGHDWLKDGHNTNVWYDNWLGESQALIRHVKDE